MTLSKVSSITWTAPNPQDVVVQGMCRSEERERERETEEERVKGLLFVKKVEVKERAAFHSKLRIGLLQKGSLPKQQYFLSIFAHTRRFPPLSPPLLYTSHTLSLSRVHTQTLSYTHTLSFTRTHCLLYSNTHTLSHTHTHS